jgi:peptidoglycan-associated lipoprotein
MGRTMRVLASLLAVGFLAGCPAKPSNGDCKNGEDCAAQEGFGKTCVEGRCQECGRDTDCKSGFVCRSLKCVPRPECEQNSDCAAGKACQAGTCVTIAPPPPECTNDAACGAGKACQAGRCVTAAPLACPAGGGKLLPIYFAYDRAILTPESLEVLAKNADCIRRMNFSAIRVEGNCDERGTDEYNLHLGQRRAEAAKKYLRHLGIPASSIWTVSFGGQRPSCLEPTESCWQKNRRDDVQAY